MVIFGPKPWVNPFEKMSIFRHFEFLLFIAQTGVFSFQNIGKDIFLAYIGLTKKIAKMAIFGPKRCVNHFGKMSIFRLFKLLVFIAQKGVLLLLFIGQKGVFLFQNIIKDISLAYISLRKKNGKIAIFGPKPWVNPFGKISFFPLFKLLVFIPQTGVFLFQNIIKDIFLAYIA